MIQSSDVETFYTTITGDTLDVLAAEMERFIGQEYQYTTWPTWSYDTTDPKEREKAAWELVDIFIKYTIFTYAEQYIRQFGRNPTLVELLSYAAVVQGVDIVE